MIKTDIENLGKWSSVEIELVCDDCKVEKSIKYKLYTSYGYSNGEYFCRKCKTKKNNLLKYGVENVFQLKEVKEKSRKTNISKRGVEFISQDANIKEKIKKSISTLDKCEINKKRINTNNIKYGVDNISQLEEIKIKKIETTKRNFGKSYIFNTQSFKDYIRYKNLKEYGVEHFFQSEKFKFLNREVCLNKYNVDNPSKNYLISEKIKKSLKLTLDKKTLKNVENIKKIDIVDYEIYCENCKADFKIGKVLFYKRREKKTEICTICNPIDKHQSGKEIILYNFIKSIYDKEMIKNFKIDKKEIDIYLPDLNIGFEFNGVYWHSDIYKEKDFHLNKSKFFEEKGIHVFHIWEDDWTEKEEILKSQIENLLGRSQRIWARKCEIKEVDDISLVRDFLNKNHIQGFVNSKIKIGLFLNSELVGLMTFDQFEGRKRMSENEWSLNRFCNKLGCSVIGGSSKLINYFIKKYNPTRIISYSDKDWSKGFLYEKLGFKKVYETKPDYKYLINLKRIHKSNFKKSITGISESNLDYPKIWDCGKTKWELIIR